MVKIRIKKGINMFILLIICDITIYNLRDKKGIKNAFALRAPFFACL